MFWTALATYARQIQASLGSRAQADQDHQGCGGLRGDLSFLLGVAAHAVTTALLCLGKWVVHTGGNSGDYGI